MTKKFLTSLMLLWLLIFQVNAQNIPNAGFESWSVVGPFESANGWGGPPSVSKSTDMHSGAFAIKLVTDTFTNPQLQTLDTLPGICYTGTQGMGPGNPGVKGYAFTDRPDSIIGLFKYAPNLNDSFIIKVDISRWDITNNVRENIGSAILSGAAANNYTRFSLPISYNSNAIPDSAVIELSNTNLIPPAAAILGSVLLVDDLAFVTNATSGIKSNNQSEINLYPNPANEKLYFSNASSIIANVAIYNALGELVMSVQNQNLMNGIAIETLNAGIYYCKIIEAQTGQTSVKKIVVE